MTLPLGAGEPPGPLFSTLFPAAGPAAGPDGDCLRGVRVLVVDDQADARDLLDRLLADRGAEVATASSAAEALTAVAGFRPHVLVSDLGMPDEDGYELMRKLRALPADQGGTIPAAAVSALARPEDERRALAAGFQLHLAKPVEVPGLIAAVARLARQAAGMCADRA